MNEGREREREGGKEGKRLRRERGGEMDEGTERKMEREKGGERDEGALLQQRQNHILDSKIKSRSNKLVFNSEPDRKSVV